MVWEAAVLGAVQGLTEFLPISSSAHLDLVPRLLGWNSTLLNSLTFDVALHLGTLLALAAYFWKDLWVLAKAWLTRGWTPQGRTDAQARLAWWMILGTLPAAVAGVLWEKRIESEFRNPLLVAACLMGVGALMWAAERYSAKQKELDRMSFWEALGVGVAQAFALMPGVSRSGITITAGLTAGFKREAAARFSFLLSIPVVAGACVLKAKELLHIQPTEVAATVLGVVVSAVVGFACIHFLLAFLRKHGLYIFVIYRWILGLAICFWVWRMHG